MSMSMKDLPPEIIRIIFSFSKQIDLYHLTICCSEFHQIITKNIILLTTLKQFLTRKQTIAYLRRKKPFENCFFEHNCVYTDIIVGEADYPFKRYGNSHYKVVKLNEVKDEVECFDLDCEKEEEGKGEENPENIRNLSLKEKDFDEYQVIEMTKENVYLTMLKMLMDFIDKDIPKDEKELKDEKGVLTFDGERLRNCNRAVRKIILHFYNSSDVIYKGIMFERFGKCKWFKERLKRIDKLQEEENLSSDEETYFTQVVDEEYLNKPVLYCCRKCKWQISNFICTKCDEYLTVKQTGDGSSECKKCSKSIPAPKCCNRSMIARSILKGILDAANDIQENENRVERDDPEISPEMSCNKCNFSIKSGVRCFKCNTKSGTRMYREGFFERCWCSYVWCCKSTCGRDRKYFDCFF